MSEVIEELIEESEFLFNEIYLNDILFKLKVELAMRRNSDYIGTKMGGNPSQLYYLMTHDARKKRSPDLDVHVSQEGNTVFFALPPKVNFIEIRKAFDKFWETCPDKNEITQDQLSNPSFLRDLNSPSIEVHLLIMGLETARDLVPWLDREAEFGKQVDQFFSTEYKAVEDGFLTEMKLPLDYFVKVNANKNQDVNDPVREVLEKHPVWGKRLSDITDRKKVITDKLLSQEDIGKLDKIGSLPTYIALFVARSVITLERMVIHNIDEKAKFFEEINSKINELFKE